MTRQGALEAFARGDYKWMCSLLGECPVGWYYRYDPQEVRIELVNRHGEMILEGNLRSKQ